MEPQSQLLKINKNEYLAQQKSKLEDALENSLLKSVLCVCRGLAV